MHDYNIIFDLESKKIGFIKARCAYQGKKIIGGDKEELLHQIKNDEGKYVTLIKDDTKTELFFSSLLIILFLLFTSILLVLAITSCRFRREDLKETTSKEKSISL